MLKYHTSYRCRSIPETLKFATEISKELGISRVTETTWLDRIGIPVFSSIRPGAIGLCVNSGKGVSREEAMVGAYMEAIEFAMAEPNKAGLQICSVPPQDIYEGKSRIDSILDFCPRINQQIDTEDKINCVETLDIQSGGKYLVPAELVYYPYYSPADKKCIFSSSTNGLASGNSFAEAVIHGVLEILERDVLSFHLIEDNTLRVDTRSLPESFTETVQKISSSGIELVLRYAPNEFGLPVFLAFIIDSQFEDPMFINAGYGCHTDKSIAASRAISECIQSRLVLIHGARDDIPHSHEIYKDLTSSERILNYRKIRQELLEAGKMISYQEIDEMQWNCDSLEDYLDKLCSFLSTKGFNHVLTARLTKSENPLQVVRTVIPKAEFFNQKNKRIGKRIKKYATEIAHSSVRWT